MILKRKDAKEYGAKKLLEGCYNKNDRCLVIEDVVTSGESILETVQVYLEFFYLIFKIIFYLRIKSLKEHGIVVSDAIVILDRSQGAKTNLEKHGIRFHRFIF